MKQLIGHISQLKYQTKEFIPNSLQDCTEEQIAIVRHALKQIQDSINNLDFYVHNRIALILETAPIIEQIEFLKDQLITNGVDPKRLEMNEMDINKIINIFTHQLEQPHNAEYFLQILHYAVNLWINEQDIQRNSLAIS